MVEMNLVDNQPVCTPSLQTLHDSMINLIYDLLDGTKGLSKIDLVVMKSLSVPLDYIPTLERTDTAIVHAVDSVSQTMSIEG